MVGVPSEVSFEPSFLPEMGFTDCDFSVFEDDPEFGVQNYVPKSLWTIVDGVIAEWTSHKRDPEYFVLGDFDAPQNIERYFEECLLMIGWRQANLRRHRHQSAQQLQRCSFV
ncbi:hypothetical protein [Corynebacterium cystitidis]|uniref:hypothetical protein n=1 Tax=Corynebacterium cystitidis TaxID=35757 RepID=UPI00211ED138|nr:hypothetical protein [Corynebacterium cystitidis]